MVVGGMGADGTLAPAGPLALARPEAGPAVSAAKAPSEARLAREVAGTKRSSCALRRALERPRESSHGSLFERSRRSRSRACSNEGIDAVKGLRAPLAR